MLFGWKKKLILESSGIIFTYFQDYNSEIFSTLSKNKLKMYFYLSLGPIKIKHERDKTVARSRVKSINSSKLEHSS